MHLICKQYKNCHLCGHYEQVHVNKEKQTLKPHTHEKETKDDQVNRPMENQSGCYMFTDKKPNKQFTYYIVTI